MTNLLLILEFGLFPLFAFFPLRALRFIASSALIKNEIVWALMEFSRRISTLPSLFILNDGRPVIRLIEISVESSGSADSVNTPWRAVGRQLIDEIVRDIEWRKKESIANFLNAECRSRTSQRWANKEYITEQEWSLNFFNYLLLIFIPRTRTSYLVSQLSTLNWSVED